MLQIHIHLTMKLSARACLNEQQFFYTRSYAENVFKVAAFSVKPHPVSVYLKAHSLNLSRTQSAEKNVSGYMETS